MHNLFRPLIGLCLVGALASCSEAVNDNPPADCTVYAWEPETGDFGTYPTAEMLVEDPSTHNGLRMSVSEADFPAVADLGNLAQLFTRDASALDGIGLVADMWLTFETAEDDGTFSPSFTQGVIARGDGLTRTNDPFGILVFPEGGEPELWPVDVRRVSSDDRFFVRPMRPLPESSRVALFATQALESATTTGCVAPSAGMRRAIRLADADRSAAITALTDLGVIESWQDLVALHVVTTQTATLESRAVAAHIETLSPEFSNHDCRTESDYRVCDATIMVQDFRDDDGVVQAPTDGSAVTPQRTWEVDVRIWLPDDGGAGAPYPTLIYGHGLSGDRGQGSGVARRFAAEGYATVAIDALLHGSHPSLMGQINDGMLGTLRFFGLDLATVTLEGLRLRDHWRQSSYDKLQLLQALIGDGDLDGDGMNDVDTSRLGYSGISLGGIMANEFVALTPNISVVMNYLGGGMYSGIVNDPASDFASLISLFLLRQDDDEIAMGFSGLQTVIEAGDAATYGAHMFTDRFPDMGPAPDYIFGVAIDDATVTNQSNYALARSLQIPLLGTEVRPEPGISPSGDPAPVTGNLTDDMGNTYTAGLLQYDIIDGSGTVATHDNVPFSDVGVAGWLPFLRSHFDNGIATLTDPFVTEGVTRP